MRYLVCLPAALLLGACAAESIPDTPPPVAAASPVVRVDPKVSLAKATAAEIPDWFVNPPREEGSVFAAGTGNSADLEFAMAKAILSAKRSLADQVGGSLSVRHKEYLQETAAGAEPVMVSDRATSNQISQVVLNGYSVVQSKLVSTESQYRAFVLLQFAGSAAPVQAPEVERDAPQQTQTKAAKAFDELQREIDAAAGKKRNDVARREAPPLP